MPVKYLSFLIWFWERSLWQRMNANTELPQVYLRKRVSTTKLFKPCRNWKHNWLETTSLTKVKTRTITVIACKLQETHSMRNPTAETKAWRDLTKYNLFLDHHWIPLYPSDFKDRFDNMLSPQVLHKWMLGHFLILASLFNAHGTPLTLTFFFFFFKFSF